MNRIPIDDYPDLVHLIEAAYDGAHVTGVVVHKITMDETDVNIEVGLNIEPTSSVAGNSRTTYDYGVHGTLQLELDDPDNPVSEKIREILQMEEKWTD